jgi:AraC-like DNA-binding protein
MTNFEIWSEFAARQKSSPPLHYVYGMHHRVFVDVYTKPHSHSSIEIVYHPSGRGITRLDARHALAFADRGAIIYAPNETHDQEMSADGEDMCVHLAPGDKHSLALPARGLHVPRIDEPILVEEIRALSRRIGQPDPVQQAIYNFRATAVLLALTRLACTHDHQNKASPDEKRVLLAEQYIRENFSTITSMRQVADHVGISPDFLRHIFTKLRKKSLVRYLSEVRIDRVKTLLIHSELSLKQIAPICGFNNEYYLSTVFRKVTGAGPGHFRKNL